MLGLAIFSIITIAIIFIPLSSAQCGAQYPLFRQRRSWSRLSPTDQETYLDALIDLGGGLDSPINNPFMHFTWQYYDAIRGEFGQAPQARTDTSAYLPWNRYFLWELESQIRDLGGKYADFTLPYWDWTEDNQFSDILDFEILNSGLGGIGDPNDNGCIQESPFAVGAPDFIKQYYTYDCPDYISSSTHFDSSSECCLERHAYPYSKPNGLSATTIVPIITNYPNYVDFKDKLATLLHPIQVAIGGEGSNLADPDSAPDDPIYFLMFSFVDSIYALWQRCHGYDEVVPYQLTGMDRMYSADGVASQIDDDLEFEVFLAYSDDARIKFPGYVRRDNILGRDPSGWLGPAPTVLKIRDMHRIGDWGYCYGDGQFFDSYWQQLSAKCPAFSIVDGPNSFAAAAPGGSNRTDNTPRTDIIWDRLVASLDLRNGSTIEDLPRPVINGIIKQWSQIDCELRQSEGGRTPCKRPKCFDDCSGLIPCDDDNGRDINVTLNELIEKVEDYPCMVETRKKMYSWAKAHGKLLELCRGDFDNFCDGNDIEGQTTVGTCSNPDARAKDDGDDDDLYTKDTEKQRKKSKRGSAYGAHFSSIDIDNHDGFGVDSKEGLRFDYNTLIIVVMIVFNVVGCFYLDRKWRKKLEKQGLKYVDQDDI